MFLGWWTARKAVPVDNDDKPDTEGEAGPRGDPRPAENPARLVEQRPTLNLFDEAAQRRFGNLISAAVLNSQKRRGKSR
jgi:hypothetical protein